ncbi:hypothetical protein E4U53_001526, partial [Claviceps sorghi]
MPQALNSKRVKSSLDSLHWRLAGVPRRVSGLIPGFDAEQLLTAQHITSGFRNRFDHRALTCDIRGDEAWPSILK